VNWKNDIWKIPSPVAGAILLVVGAVGIWRCPDSLGLRFSEALLTAGILSITVDLYLKRKLQEDAARDIFHHLLGVNLPDDLREKLKNFLFENKTYGKNVCIDVDATQASDGIVLTVCVSSTIVAASDSEYRQGLWFEESENPKILQASVTSTMTPSISYTEQNPLLARKKDEPAVLEWRGKRVVMRRGDELTSYAKFSLMKQPASGFWVHNFGASVIYPRLRISASDALTITASKADQVNGNEHIYKRVFLKGDHIQIRWKPKEIL
jgi:hypothetical protein